METIEKLEKIIDNAGYLLIHNGLMPCRNYINSQLDLLTISLEYDLALTDQDINIINAIKDQMKSCFTLQEVVTGLQGSYNFLQECKKNILK